MISLIKRALRSVILPSVGALCGLLAACQSVTDKPQQAGQDWLTPPYSASTFLVTDVMPLPYTAPLTDSEQRAADSIRREVAFGLFAFAPDSTCALVLRNRLLESRYRLRGRVLGTSLGTGRNVRQTPYGFTMTLPVSGAAGAIGLRCALHWIEFGPDKLRVLALARAVFTHPATPETDAQIRVRVKHCLAFYSLYFKAIYANQLNRFRPDAVAMPIRFYNGGLRLANYEPDAPWKGLYATTENTRNAHRYFRKAIKSVRFYPERGNLLLEYSVVFQQMSDFL